MKKRLTAFLLACMMLCTLLPTAFAVDSADASSSVPFAAELSDGETNFSKTVASGETVYRSNVLSQAAHEEALADADFTEVTYSRNYSAQESTQSTNYSELTTNGFTCYGDQLYSVYYDFGGTEVAVGAAMTQMYKNMKADLAKGKSSAIFKNDAAGEKKLGVTFTLPKRSSLGISTGTYENLAANFTQAASWLVYRCIDFDCPEMFYSNGNCAMGYSLSGNKLTIYARPLGDKGLETYSERAALQDKLDAQVNAVVNQAKSYSTAYEKLQFFNRWLCDNNEYNNEAVSSNDRLYQINVSGAPWSAVSALLSCTGETVGPVCEGYSRAFQLLCHKIGVTATVVVSDSGDHMWNNVKYGTRWTGVDVTWNDNGANSSETYFFQQVNGIGGHVLDDEDFVDWLYYPSLTALTADETLPYYISGVSGDKILPFYDVADNHWGLSFIRNVYDKGYMTGTSIVKFGTKNTLTRAEFAQILYSLAGKPEVSYSDRFPDVKEGKWYTSAVLWAAENGLVSGYPNGKFGVSDNIRREDLSLILFRRAGSPETGSADLESRFTDAASIHAYAYVGVNWAVASGIIGGTNTGALNPRNNTTRAETAVIITNITKEPAEPEEPTESTEPTESPETTETAE